MRFKRPFFALICLAVSFVGSARPRAAESCGQIFFSEGPYFDRALEMALKKAKSGDKKRGLSTKDLHWLVRSVFRKTEGQAHKFSDYVKMNSDQRVLSSVERKIGEAITKEGLVRFLQSEGLIVDKSLLRTKLEILNESMAFNVLSAAWGIVSAAKGAPPVLLPEFSFKIKAEDFQSLLLEGVDSSVGQQILSKYKIRLELNRGYDLFSQYYTRAALVVLLYLAYDEVADLLHDCESPEGRVDLENLKKEIEDRVHLLVKDISPRHFREQFFESSP